MNTQNIKKDFPLLTLKHNGQPIIYLDSAATTQKPQAVIDALSSFYSNYNANVHRGIYDLSEKATELYEEARAKVARFINARDALEIVFTRNTTESINLVAATWGQQHICTDDAILITELEHHSNLLPWQRLAHQKNAQLNYIPVNHDGTLNLDTLNQLLTSKTKLVAMSHVSNALGVHNPIKTIIDQAHTIGAKVLIDAAQSVPHQPIDVQKMNCDFLAFSGHKILGPTGIGVLYIKKELHQDIEPYQVGGGMVFSVDFNHAQWRPMPHRLEAGTPAIAQAIGLGAALDYLQSTIDWATLRTLESSLTAQFIDGIFSIPSIRLLGPQHELKKVGHMVTFVVDSMHAHDVAAYLNTQGISVRAGHQCAQPLAKKLNIDASVRASFYLYNDSSDVDRCVQALKKLHTEL